ncbi:hypothetical protein J6W34_03615 [bacterium]|nr:hypothetical protein [bacterium]
MELLYKIYLHFIYANSIPVICRTIEETIVFIGILIFLYKMFTLFDFRYESDITYKDRPSDSYIWKIETKEPENKENNN